MTVEYKNPVYNENGTVDVEINHPDFGWIPFTASPDDVEQFGKDLFDFIKETGGIDPYIPPPESEPIIPDRVTARQFGLQLITLGLKDEVDTWVASQDAATQWAYEKSSTFVKTDEMMQTGFAALGFTSEQIDQFFIDASLL